MPVRLGDIVIYRSRSGVDMAAIVTQVGISATDGSEPYLHLSLFPPPGEAADPLSHQWGAPHQSDALIGVACWRRRDEEPA